ncbi:UEV-domain-containing protein [Sistotremastrum suecicum HHB10207 ss-3]|uniref:UEV-domain-containing protein n=1 Tax=Sistotremastrum suecicum HHB10207 ss-3 TaxID=1314776 RepID=A0A166C157_9AGAM|nr:UEV-domain-containing protein [Sistotremastrum suecicum HHB10207 ss-3]
MDGLHSWLSNAVRTYPRKEILYRHVDALLAHYSSLRPKTDMYTFDDGRTQLLLCVYGLLPITFRNAQYNIPVSLWMTDEYPSKPPIVYVVPTPSMLVKASKHVDASGLVNIPYMDQWLRKSEACHLSGLVDAMRDLFSRDPPLYAKPARQSTSDSPAINYNNRPPPLPPPAIPPKVLALSSQTWLMCPSLLLL